MIRVELEGESSPGISAWTVPSLSLSGRSRQPLLDACRAIKAAGGPTTERAGAFREGDKEPCISCGIEYGAGVTVSEPSKAPMRFEKWVPFKGVEKE